MCNTSCVHICLVDDHAVVRAGYRRFLEQEVDFQVTLEANSGEAACGLIQQHSVDIVMLDLSMPGEGGFAAIRRLKQRWPSLPVLVFSMHDHPTFAIQTLRAGAVGYITKSSDPVIVVMALHKALAGAIVLSPDIERRIADLDLHGCSMPVLGLSAREFDVFRLIASGLSHAEIAGLLSVSVKTVTNLHSTIRQKLPIRNDIELYHLAVECGAIDVRAIVPDVG